MSFEPPCVHKLISTYLVIRVVLSYPSYGFNHQPPRGEKFDQAISGTYGSRRGNGGVVDLPQPAHQRLAVPDDVCLLLAPVRAYQQLDVEVVYDLCEKQPHCDISVLAICMGRREESRMVKVLARRVFAYSRARPSSSPRSSAARPRRAGTLRGRRLHTRGRHASAQVRTSRGF